ncbi:hypothetical protein DRW42_21165 [Pedobacter miscanthi]|uniref:Uncharacterized protein n=1 Tax=Pedobacter miscanthi TaxID=2259170 RepID=A0A366KPD6_9SPHI|nr:hypothetical protein DRW42_21165 [Pedobacter miscanthi]
MVACFAPQTGLTEGRPSIPGAGKSKKQLQNKTIGIAKPKRSGFVQVLQKTLICLILTAQNKVPLFF